MRVPNGFTWSNLQAGGCYCLPFPFRRAGVIRTPLPSQSDPEPRGLAELGACSPSDERRKALNAETWLQGEELAETYMPMRRRMCLLPALPLPSQG